MYSMGENAKSKKTLQERIQEFNHNFFIEDQIPVIQNHLKKAKVVVIDLRHLNAQNRAKIGAYVASLPEKQQQRIDLIVKEYQ